MAILADKNALIKVQDLSVYCELWNAVYSESGFLRIIAVGRHETRISPPSTSWRIAVHPSIHPSIHRFLFQLVFFFLSFFLIEIA